MSEHVIDSSEPYHPEKLEKKDYVGAAAYFELDLRTGIILKVEEFPEMRKPSYKIEVDFGPIIGKLWSSASDHQLASSRVSWTNCSWSIESGRQDVTNRFCQFLVLGALDPNWYGKVARTSKRVKPGSMVA